MHRHAETRTVPYTPKQMFDLVSDVGSYAEFLPWCLAVRITDRADGMLWADLVVGKGPFRETFTSKVMLDDGGGGGDPRIDVDYIKGPMREMSNHWVFRQGADGGTEIDFMVEFEFKSRMLDAMMHGFFDHTVMQMVDAFLKRADTLYGAAA
ncbi:MAG: type II toxin-antitoxin system RatA family toxin [Alphaproteobacteria bacterium]|nr:type II toxin-antitoxin system RatA family toxin [Alphaproteobacteria bacterium]